jgi:hypothetical protein
MRAAGQIEKSPGRSFLTFIASSGIQRMRVFLEKDAGNPNGRERSISHKQETKTKNIVETGNKNMKNSCNQVNPDAGFRKKTSLLKIIPIISLVMLSMMVGSCMDPSYDSSGGYRSVNARSRSDWNAYRSTSPYGSLKMWAVSLPDDDKAGLGCVDDKNFAELSRWVNQSEAVARSTEDPEIREHMLETVGFWREVISAQPALKQKAAIIDQRIRNAGDRGFDAGSQMSRGSDFVTRNHVAPIMGLGAMLANFGPMMELYRPHVARYAPRALALAKREQALDRKFRQTGDCVEFLRRTIEELEKTVSEIR